MEELDEFGIPIKKTAKPSVSVDEFGIPIKKKDSSTGTVTPKKLVSEPQNGSSGGKGFPKIDTNSVAPGYGVQPKVSVAKNKPKSTIVNLEKPKEDISFFDYLKDNLDTGLANVSKSLYDAPGFIYDVAASVTNPVFEAFGVSKDKLASSDKLADDLGFRNIPSEILKEKIKVSNDKINAYAAKNGGDAFAALENGNYSGAAKLVAGSTVQSLPIMVAAMASGGQTTALSAIGLSTASTKNAELKESNPEMGLGTRVTNATNAGIIEAVTGHLFTGASGAVMKKILAEKGVEAGSKIISKSLRSTIEKSIEKNPFVGALGEVVEESAVEFGNQLNDMSSGIRTEFDVHAIKNAGLSATGMGGLQTLGVYGAKGYVKAKDYAKLKATNKEVFKLRGEIANGNLSDENKALLTLRADRLEAGNKKLLGTEIEKVKALPTELKTELNALNVEFESLKSKFDDIDDADDIPDNLKPAMKEEIKVQASLNQKRKIEILSQNDGLIVDNDFSNFDGVDPDFDLENGKISSLPLKEQDRLNKLAVEQITGGDKTIEYTKEQVSQTANEIYKNEQNPEANQIKETVSEVSPVPSVSEGEGVSKVVENPLSSQENNKEEVAKNVNVPKFNIDGKEEFHHASDSKRNGRLKISNAPQFGTGVYFSTNKGLVENEYGSDNTTSVKLNIENPVYSGSKEWNEVNSLAIEKADKDYGEKKGLKLGEDETYFRYDKDNLSEIDEIPSKFISDAAKELGYDAIIDKGSSEYENEVVVLDESKIIYPEDEATPTSNTPTNGNLPLGADNVGENGITKSETPIAESVPSAVDGGENKGDAEVGRDKLLKKADALVDGTTKLYETVFNKQDEFLKTKSLTVKDLDKMSKEDYEKLNEEWRAYDKANKEKAKLLETPKNDIDNAIAEIDKGVLNWNGDTGAERVVLGITWADIRKGEKDIKAGKVDTAPAKKLIEALKTAKENGGYEYKQGSGGQIQKQFVSLEDIQRSNNEYKLTDAEQKEIDASEFESAREYDKNFNSLSEQEQIEILENYENSQNDSGTPSADSGQSQSKNDVSSEKEGTGENSGAKEKIDNKDLESFRDKIKDIPESGVIAKYLSGDTIERVEGETPRNNQEIDTIKLSAAGNHGKETVAQAKELFGEQYVEKSLEFLDGNTLKAHEKAILYVSLENEMYNRRILDPENLGLQKLQDLVRKKSQQHLRESSLAINAGRLRAIMKDGYISDSVTDKLFSSEELKNKRKIEKAIQADADAINKEAERQENNPIDSDLEKLISSGVEKQINEIYKKLPTNRRVRADKAITALENIQSKLRGKAYDASIGIPIALIDSGITIIKNSIKAGVNIADAIEIGINHIKEKYGKDWNKEDDFRSDMLDGFKDEGIEIKEPTVKEKTKQQEYKELVKQSLIEAGFGREITVRTKEGKEQRQTLDWKKLAGEEGSIDKIKENVEKSLKDNGYTDSQISDIQNDLETEYNNLRASIIEKSLNELNNRNTPRKPVNIKTSAKKLAELYNYGLFEKEADTYDHLMNSALGMNQLGQDNFMEAKRLAGKLSELFTQKDKDGNNISQSSLKHGERVINKQIEHLLSKVAWADSDGAYKAMIVTKELVSLCQRNALVSVAQALENTTSGYISRFYTKIGFSLDKVDTKSLAKVRRTLSQMTYKDITLNGGLEFGDITSPFISKSKAQDFIVNAIDSKFYHGLASFALGKAYLESADSMHKSALTEKFFQYNLIKVLRAKGYTKNEAINYVAEQLTGQTLDDALVTAKQIIDNINKDSAEKVIPDTKESIFRFAHDIVRESLLQGEKMTIEEVEASFRSAETAAGFELGHEANNVTSQGLKLLGSHIQIKIDRAVKEKDWATATAQTGSSIIVSNVLNPFVGGGTNWALIALQKSGVPTLSTFYWNIKARSSKIDLTSEQGIKNLEKTLKYQLLAKNANTRLVVGATVSMAAFMLMKSTGSDDDLYEWLKKHPWANRYLKKIAPPAVQLMLAQKDKKVGEAIAQQMNIKADAFDEGKKIKRIFTDISSGKVDKAMGGAGQLAGSRFSMPVIPWRVARDVKNIYRGLAGLPEIKFDYKTSGFFNGYYQGGMLEQMGLRPDPNYIEPEKGGKFKMPGLEPKKFKLPKF